MSAHSIPTRLRSQTAAVLWRLRRESIALLAGLLASLAAVLMMGFLRLWWGTLTPPELVGERLLPLMSADQFVALLIRFQPHPKTGPLGLALLGQCIIGILLAPLYAAAVRALEKRRMVHDSRDRQSVELSAPGWFPSRPAWVVAAGFAVGMELIAVVLFWPVLPEGLYGDPIDTARLLTIVSLGLTFAAYATVLAASYQILRRGWGAWAFVELATVDSRGQIEEAGVSSSPAGASLSRRQALAAGGAAVGLIVVGAWAGDALWNGYLSRSNLAYEGHGTTGLPTSPITPTSDFYVVSKNVLDPTVASGRWRLELTGLVRRARSWTYSELLQLPSETRAVTLECISNEVGGRLLSTALWRGVTLENLLNLAGGVDPVAGKHVVFYAVDGFATSLPLDELLQVRTLVAWQMNGTPLPDRHGFPLRAVVPGRYGEQSAKWVTRIDITDQDFKGFYQSQGWSAAPLPTFSRIDQPRGRVRTGAVPISGVAFSGTRGISRVEVSPDSGSTWSVASLVPPLSDQTWVLWSWIWHPTGAGPYTIVARATDGSGALQTSVQRGTVPDGATGWPSAKVLVVK
jgi:DMSO/TMAO reductase YedYZ molybdopterin-dependent catalytic subunit